MRTDDERLPDGVRRLLAEADPVPPAPREEIWARIQAERLARRPSTNGAAGPVAPRTPVAPAELGPADVVPLRPRAGQRRWVPWGAALAAMLVLGIGLGRLTAPVPGTDRPVAATPQAPAAEPVEVTPYRLAAAQHLQRTETLLAALGTEARRGDMAELTAWAHELLTGTRMLLASPAAEDPATARLLEDLELVLAQIAAIPQARAREEVELIQEGLNQSDVLMRLRVATAVRRTAGT